MYLYTVVSHRAGDCRLASVLGSAVSPHVLSVVDGCLGMRSSWLGFAAKDGKKMKRKGEGRNHTTRCGRLALRLFPIFPKRQGPRFQVSGFLYKVWSTYCWFCKSSGVSGGARCLHVYVVTAATPQTPL